jgi:hypothetical protein
MRPASCAIAFATLALSMVAFGVTPACTTHSCTAVYYPSRATIERTITAHFDPTKPLHVEMCKNDDCASGDFVVATGTVSTPRLCLMDGSVLAVTGCAFGATGNGGYTFTAVWFGDATPWNDGDRYRATLTSSDGTLVSVDAKATYSVSEPNGEGCGVVKRATL